MCCVRNPRNINVFVRVPGREESGSRPRGLVTGVIEKIVYVPNVYVPFPPLTSRTKVCRVKNPRDPDIVKTVCVANLLSVVNLHFQ